MNTTIIDLEIIQKQNRLIIIKNEIGCYLSDSEGDLYDDFCMIDDIYVTKGN